MRRSAYAAVFTVVFIVMGLVAPNGQAAQGLSLIAFIFAFLSSAYVPATSMPGWLQPFARYQPITPMVDAVRSLLTGSTSDVGLALAWSGLLVAVFTPIAVWRYRRARGRAGSSAPSPHAGGADVLAGLLRWMLRRRRWPSTARCRASTAAR